MKKRYVTIHEIDTDKVQARRTLEDWVTYLEDDAAGDFTGEPTWDAVYETIILEFIMSGDFTEFVTEIDGGFVGQIEIV